MVIVNLLGALILEVCILLRAFGVPLTDAQQNSINAVAGLLIMLGAALIARRFTTPLASPRDSLRRPLVPEVPPHGRRPSGGGGAALG